MDKIRISLDDKKFKTKPSGDEARHISNRIAGSVKVLDLKDLRKAAFSIGQDGCTFCPAIFKNGKRNKDNFEQQQLIALDFDNKGSERKLLFEEIKERADNYGLPLLFAYETFSSTNNDRFRVVFLNH